MSRPYPHGRRGAKKKLRRKSISYLRRSHSLESLEARLLLAVTPTLGSNAVTFDGDAASDDLWLRLNASDQLEYSVDQGGSFSADMGTAAPKYIGVFAGARD